MKQMPQGLTQVQVHPLRQQEPLNHQMNTTHQMRFLQLLVPYLARLRYMGELRTWHIPLSSASPNLIKRMVR